MIFYASFFENWKYGSHSKSTQYEKKFIVIRKSVYTLEPQLDSASVSLGPVIFSARKYLYRHYIEAANRWR